MKTSDNIFGHFTPHFDELNTINGGISASMLQRKVHDWGIELVVRTPSLPPSAYKVEVQGHGLAIYTVLPGGDAEEEGEERIVVPGFFQKFPLSYRTDMNNIQAIYEKKRLRVLIPNRNDLPERFPIQIEEKQ